MKGPGALKASAGHIRSRMGGCVLGSHAVFRGHDLHRDLADMDWLELHVFGITGRRFTPRQMRVLQAIWTHTSYPDARIWNNRVAALAGTSRSTGALGLSAAVAVSEAKIYGLGPGVGAYDFLAKARWAAARGEALEALVREELKANRGIDGYGRPLVARDERIAPLMSVAAAAGMDGGPHLQIALRVDEILRNGRWRLGMNYAALTAALPLDMGFARQEYYLLMVHIFLAGMAPCFIEAAERPAGTLLPLACDDVAYDGPPRRTWSPSNPRTP